MLFSLYRNNLFERIFMSNSFDLVRIGNTVSNVSLMFAYLLHALTLSVSIIVVSVPEGLPMMVTLVLSSNMKRMLNDHVLVRKMVGIETAGSLNILFTDKTGTLTKGMLEVTGFMLGNGKKYSDLNEVSSRYCSVFVESFYDKDLNQIVGGNITDKAILNYVKINRRESVKILQHTLFDSNNKYSMVCIEENGKMRRFVKGASEVLLSCCNRYVNEEGNLQILFHRDELVNKIQDITNLGIRVLCVAYQDNINKGMNDLTLIGFLLIKDEIREESIVGVQTIQKAGIQVVMITGDYKGTAVSIAREVGILKEGDDIVLTSNELNSMSREELMKVLPRLRVVARAMPDDKSKLVNLARSMNLVVGMTGDGVNDAIALKKADVGFSMGSGTEVSKEASDIVILDDNIMSIGKAIVYGRSIFKSIRKFSIFQ